MRTFLLTRRPLIPLLFAAILVIVLCRYADAPYAIASLNLALDTPMTFLIPGVLGATAALLSHSSTPDMEQVATPRLAQHRTILLAAVVLTQWVYLLGAAWAMHRFASVDVLPEITAQLWWATVFYQGICILSAAAFTSVKMWILLSSCSPFPSCSDTPQTQRPTGGTFFSPFTRSPPPLQSCS